MPTRARGRRSTAGNARVLAAALALRRSLHRHPEPSNDEAGTAATIEEFLEVFGLRPARRRVGGHGLFYTVRGEGVGPRRLFRADLDALPIHERSGRPYASRRKGVHHACGHDGHMAMLAAALALLAKSPTFPGTVHGLFQPAEETGEGGRRTHAALSDQAFDRVFAVHNYPGIPLGTMAVRRGVAARASTGIAVRVDGRRGHASEPDLAQNPLPALSRLALALQGRTTVGDRFRGRGLATLVGWSADGPNFGVSPGMASLYATLRGDRERDVEALVARVETWRRRAERDGLRVTLDRHDPFPETTNDPSAAAEAERAARAGGLRVVAPRHPLSASEDFGHFTRAWPGALVLLGAGRDHPALHSAAYDFPDRALPLGVRFWQRLAHAP